MSADTKLRELADRMVAMAPEPPPYPETRLTQPSDSRRVRPVLVFAAAATAVIVVVGLIPLLFGGVEDDVVDGVVTPPTSTANEANVIAPPEFDWQIHDVGGYVTYPTTVSDGYVGLLDGLVASSDDGISWEVWDSQPADGDLATLVTVERALAYHDNSLFFISRSHQDQTPRVFVAQPDRSWTEIAVESGSDPSDDYHPLVSVGSNGLVVSTARGTWIVSLDGARTLSKDQQIVPTLQWDYTVEPSWTNLDPPTPDVRGIEVRDGTMVAIDWNGNAWMSANGEAWNPIPRIATDGDLSCISPTPDAVAPMNIETGPLGWFAAGASCKTPTIWYSSNGIDWHIIDNIEDMDVFDIFLPYPPVFLVQDDRVFIYAKQPGARQPTSLWIGTPTN